MKKRFIIALFFIFHLIQSSQDQELLNQASSFFLQGKFSQAREIYEKIQSKDSAIWNNIGNCFFNEKDYLKALICWKRAENGATFNQLKKLYDSENTVLENMSCYHENNFLQIIKQIILGSSKLFLQFLLLILLTIFLFICYKNIYKQKSFNFKKRYFLLLIAIFSTLLILISKQKLIYEKCAVVISAKATTYIGPETTFPQKDTLSLGNIVTILDKKSEMTKVKSHKSSGWIKNENIEII
jgi:tetratricopeptide (TPR) repeat protein